MLHEKQEEIMEAIWCAAEQEEYSTESIRKICSIDFTETDLRELERLGMIIIDQETVMFTKTGNSVAQEIIRRHRLAEVLVSSILKLKDAAMEEVACKVEHSLVPEVEDSICTLLGHPEICPDGKPIPKGRCCKRNLREVSNVVVSLTDIKPGKKGKITYIKPGSHSNMHQLLSIGLHPGIIVTVHRTNPAFCIKFENTELALDREIAENIFVWEVKENQ